MFGIGFTELFLILIVALIVIGPDKLPGIAKALGKAFIEFKRASEEVRRSISDIPDLTKPDTAKPGKEAPAAKTPNQAPAQSQTSEKEEPPGPDKKATV